MNRYCLKRSTIQATLKLTFAASVYWVALSAASAAEPAASPRPNFVIIFTDDQGYGDLGCYGSETIRTPCIDQLAKEGTRFTSFYVQVVCGPSRSALLTGRYPVRSLGWSMPADEITLAELLQRAGYATGCIGKWDVSNRAAIPDRMPNAQGFDYYFGTLGANDDGRVVFHENNQQVGETQDMASLTRLYTDRGIEFLRQNKDRPFLLYVAHTMTHSVIDASPEFKGKSRGGLFGDTVEELDFHTGRLLDALDEQGLRQNTVVIFTTDNGAWNNFQDVLRPRHNGQVAWGSSGPLREGKGSTYEGGIRVPCIARWPEKIPAGRTNDAVFSTIDFLPTFGKLAGYDVPTDRIVDGVDQTELLLGRSEEGARDDYFYFCQGELQAVRKGNWKLLLADRRKIYGYVDDKGSGGVELYDLAQDIGEKTNLAAAHPEVVQDLLRHATSHPWPDARYDERIGLNTRSQPASRVPAPLPRGDWIAHGLTADQREQIHAAFQAGIDNRFIPGGALMLIHRGEVIFDEAFGVADLETQRPFLVSSPCHIASLTKPHTATVLAMLAQQGLVSLDEPVDRYLPEFKGVTVRGVGPAKQAPTLRQCLSHTAGFAGNESERDDNDVVRRDGTLQEMVEDLGQQDLLSEPGTHYAYSRLGYVVAGRVAEVVTGRPFPEVMRRLLLDPLGATDATFTPTPEVGSQIPVSYVRTADGFQVRERMQFESVVNPAGSLVSTLDNVGRFMLLHRNRGRVGEKQVVTEEALQQMYVPQPGTLGTGYGLGFNVMQRRPDGTASRIRHTGASGTLAVLDFEHDLIVVVLTQVPQTQTMRWRDRLVRTVGEVLAATSVEEQR